ncbi:MAG: translation initiation factor IF-1, partial [Synechococcus sp. SB0672_bin_10]|nr:translation initiation factor IF-1 [Synechococcus sp. SB0672_bin_10]
KVTVEISPYDLTRGRITYRERNMGAPRGGGGHRPGGRQRR